MRPALLALAIAVALIAPYGEYAVNDDWTFAHLAKQTAETGRVTLNAPLAPNAVGQALAGAAVVKLAGFSHLALRMATLLLSVAGLWAVYRLGRSKMATMLLALNPIWLYSGLSFMNELWGWVPALLGAVLWLGAKSWRRLPVAALIIGLTFWNRQLSVLVYPALVAAWLSRAQGRLGWRFLVLPTLAWLAPILAYFAWATSTGNLRPEFTDRAQNLLKLDASTWVLQSGAGLMYLTMFCLPWLVLLGWPKTTKRRAISIGLVGLAVLARIGFQDFPTDAWVGPTWGHRIWPWGMNIIHAGGVGPVTMDDAYFARAPVPELPRGLWMALEFGLMLACGMWAALQPKRLNEAGRFAVALGGICLVAIIQSHQMEVVDRYWLPIIIAAHIALPQMVDTETAFYDWRKFALFALPAVAVAVFSVLGLHDQFRWMDARQELIREAQKRGATPETTAAGWEVNCWHKFQTNWGPDKCGGFCCIGDTWRIGTAVLPGYEPISSVMPNRWLASGPAITLSRRK